MSDNEIDNGIIDDIFDSSVTVSKDITTVKVVDESDESDDIEPVTAKDETKDVVSELEKLKQELEKIKKQESDTKKWGNQNRECYMRAKKKTDELAKRMHEEGIIFDEDFDELSKVFEVNLEETSSDTSVNNDVENTPIKNVVSTLKKTFDEFKKWSDEPDLDAKFSAFYKDLDLVTDKRFNEIQEYMLSETDPKVLLRYVLDRGEKSYEKLYKPILEKGDALSYIEELLLKNEKLEKQLNDLKFELDDTEEKVYTKSNKSNTYKSNKKDILSSDFDL